MSNGLIKVGEELRQWFEYLFVDHVPGRIGHFIRQWYWSRRFHQCRSISIGVGCFISSPKNISMGENISIMPRCYLYAHKGGQISFGNRVALNNNVSISAADGGKITIGNDVLVGPNVVVRASNHQFGRKDIPIIEQEHQSGSIIINDDVWIGANVVILPEVTIGTGAVIGAGAVVNRDIPAYAFAAGVPAKIIKEDCRRERATL